MPKKTIGLIEDDDGVTVVVAAPTWEIVERDAVSLREAFGAYRNKNYPDPSVLSAPEFDEEGGLACTFDVCYPIRVAREVVEDWLEENTQIHQKDTDDTYSYW
jgi:hypothetical protein